MNSQIVTLAYDLNTVEDWADLVEYTWGDASTTWGAIRSFNDSHPSPYNCTIYELGVYEHRGFTCFLWDTRYAFHRFYMQETNKRTLTLWPRYGVASLVSLEYQWGSLAALCRPTFFCHPTFYCHHPTFFCHPTFSAQVTAMEARRAAPGINVRAFTVFSESRCCCATKSL